MLTYGEGNDPYSCTVVVTTRLGRKVTLAGDRSQLPLWRIDRASLPDQLPGGSGARAEKFLELVDALELVDDASSCWLRWRAYANSHPWEPGMGVRPPLARCVYAGHVVSLYDRFIEVIEPLTSRRVIGTSGAVEEAGPIELATTDMRKAISGADLILVSVPTFAHRYVASS